MSNSNAASRGLSSRLVNSGNLFAAIGGVTAWPIFAVVQWRQRSPRPPNVNQLPDRIRIDIGLPPQEQADPWRFR